MKDLLFDHIPFSKGGSSLTAANVRLLCAKHNLEKSERFYRLRAGFSRELQPLSMWKTSLDN